jgi:hypothetical protein
MHKTILIGLDRLHQPCFELFNCYLFLFHIKHKQVGSEREIKNYAELNKK